tara:strand:- start:596 stop:1333 length:738 start_codon:yes stop_codon:yes gene_type:complete
MKIKHIWLFIISILFVGNVMSQDSLSIEKDGGFKVFSLRLGVDLLKPLKTNFDDNFQGLEIVGDLKINRRVFIAAELGSEKKTQQTEQINFTTNGSYIKLGLDYNFFNNWKGMDNSLFVGLRLSNSIHSHKVNEYIIYENYTAEDYKNTYFERAIIKEGGLIGEKEQLNSSWIEIIFGTKVEVLNDFYVGASIRLHRLLNNSQPESFGNLYAPGFNKIVDENRFGASFNYTLNYRLPFSFKKNKI